MPALPAMLLQTAPSTAAKLESEAAAAASGAFDWSRVDWMGIAINWAVALAILLVGIWVARWLSGAFERALLRAKVETTLANFLRNVSYALVVVLVVVSALQKVGVPPTSLAAVIGAAGLGVGLALKDSLSNIASGVMLIVLRPMYDGETVNIAGMDGVVDEIRIFHTTLVTTDNRVITIPNASVTADPIINYSRLPTRRSQVNVGVGYQDDLKKAKDILMEMATSHPKVLKDPAPTVTVTELGASSINLQLYAFSSNADNTQVQSDLIEGASQRLQAAGISIPFPQRDLHLLYVDENGKPVPALQSQSPPAVVPPVADTQSGSSGGGSQTG